MDSTRPTTEMDSLKARLRATWTAGDFGQIAKSYEHGARDFVATLGLRRDDQVLDVACGTGNVAIPAARAGALVTGIDIAPNLIEQAIVKNDAEGLTAEFDIGDAEAMPYDDNSFDVVVTMFGGMFTPRPDVLSAELGRVCRQGGTIAMANWTPEGFIGQMFRVTGEHVTPPAGMPSPLLWGSEETARERLADHVNNLEMTRQNILFTFPFGPVDVVECFRMYYGPTQKAFESLDRPGQQRLRNDLESLWTVHNQAADGTTMVESEYLEVRAVRA